jgi:lysozyme
MNSQLPTPTNIKEQLTRDEGGDWEFPYDDAEGKRFLLGETLKGNLTIGIGINLSAGFSQIERDMIFNYRLGIATKALGSNWAWALGLDDVRQGAMVNMIFNMGAAKFAGFHDFLTKLEARDYAGAAAAMLDSNWARQVGARAVRLSEQILNGTWQ